MLKVALAGNPNCGKTTLFNLLTGSNQYVGNRPGVTVDKKEAYVKDNREMIIIDLPGVYSLSPFSPEETYTRDFLIDETPDVIINLVDASNLGRSLYLTTQLLELGIPIVLAVNMIDKLKHTGSKINAETLSDLLGAPVICISTSKSEDPSMLLNKVKETMHSRQIKPIIYPNSVNQILSQCEKLFAEQKSRTFLAVKALEKDKKFLDLLSADNRIKIKKLSCELEDATNSKAEDFFAAARYKYIDKTLAMSLSTEPYRKSISQKIDCIVLNRFFAFPVFFAVIFLIYYVCVALAGSKFAEFTDRLALDTVITESVRNLLKTVNCSNWLQDLVINGIFPTVSSVLHFVPQIFMLFFALGILEESGYMSRIAFLTDRIFRLAGLSGKSFIPLLIGSGCSVPAVMSTRTIESTSQRRMSIIVTPFIPCSAKLTVITFISSIMFKNSRYTLMVAFIFAVTAVFFSGMLLKDTRKFKNGHSAFLMELPSYSFPSIKSVTKNAALQSMLFIKKAGSVILLSSVAIWFLSSFSFVHSRFTPTENFEESLIGSLGSMVAPFFAPLGFGSGELSVAVISGLFAKENIVGTIEVLSGKFMLTEQMTSASALSFLAFNLLCPPCVVAINAIRREMDSVKHTVFALAYQLVFAYFTAFLVFQIGRLFC